MPRSTQQIIDQAEQLADYFESGFTSDTPEELAVLRAAAHRRAVAEADIAKAVVAAAQAGLSWRAIGQAVGTTGEAARQRYGKLVGDKPTHGRRLPHGIKVTASIWRDFGTEVISGTPRVAGARGRRVAGKAASKQSPDR